MTNRRPARKISSALIADDHGVTRFGLLEFLRSKLGVPSPLDAPSFSTALELLKKQPIDLAIFDLDLPGLRTPSELSSVRSICPSAKLVVLSGSDKRSDILAALEAGAHGYIVKTETMEDLAERLGYIMAGEIYVPSCLADLSRSPAEAQVAAPVSRNAPAGGGVKLTDRQRQVLKAMVRGRSNKQIAKELELSIGTVKMHVSAVLTALGAQNRLHAASLGRTLVE